MQLLQPIEQALDSIRQPIRRVVGIMAVWLNRLSGGRITPRSITLIGLAAHLPVAWAIATRHNVWAAGLLAFFGLFDTLDGSLARLQNRSSAAGMLLDATTDRFKEVMIYCGAAYALVQTGYGSWVPWSVAACGASLSVSYIKAKGEMAVKNRKLTPNQLNRLFADGIMRFEVRMSVLFAALLLNRLIEGLVFIAVASALTAVGRLVKISRVLQ